MSYKVMIVDDKPLIRQSLIRTVDWERLGCEVAGEAEDGLSARKIAEQIRPDLIISDIKMPGMDGLELTACLKKSLPDTKVIIITGYQEFEYAQKALSLGVSDLILKPIRNEDLEEKVQKALESLAKSRILTSAARVSRKARQEHFLHELLKDRIPTDSRLIETAAELGLGGRDYFLVLSRVRCNDTGVEKAVRTMIIGWMEAHQAQNGWLVFEWIFGKNQILVIFEQEKKSARERKINLKNSLWTLEQKIKEKHEVSCCFAVSRNSNDLRSLPECRKNAEEIMENCYFTVEQSILFADSYTIESSDQISSVLKEMDRFYQCLEHIDRTELKVRSDCIISEIVAEAQGDEFRIKCLLTEIGITILRQWKGGDVNAFMEKISHLEGKKQCGEFLYGFLLDMQEQIQKGKQAGNPLIADGLDYIKRHYRENLSLSDLAEKMAVNPSYLSRLFKKETGRNFSEILTQCRINQAKYLLEQPGSRVIEVCEQVGYSDYTYFYQVFKKIVNISPSEYKKQVKKTNEL